MGAILTAPAGGWEAGKRDGLKGDFVERNFHCMLKM